MLCTIHRAPLATRLAQLKRVLPSSGEKNTVPILNTILFECASSGFVTATATDLELTARVRVPARVMQAGRVCLPGKLFADYLALMQEAEELRVSSATNASWVVFESEWVSEGGSLVKDRTRLRGYDPEEYPSIPAAAGGGEGGSISTPAPRYSSSNEEEEDRGRLHRASIQIESAPLKKALREVLPFVEKEVKYQSLSVYTNVQLTVEEEESGGSSLLTLTAGNGRLFARTRVSVQKSFSTTHECHKSYTTLVYGSTLKRIADLLPEGETLQLHLASDEKSLRFVLPSSAMTLMCRTTTATSTFAGQDEGTTKYPDVRKHFSTSGRESIIRVERVSLLKALKRMKLVMEKAASSGRYSNQYDVRLTMSHAVSTGLHLESVKTNEEVADEALHLKVPASLVGRPFDYYAVGKQLEDILSRMTDVGTITLAIDHTQESFLVMPLVPSGLSYVVKEADVEKEAVRQEERHQVDEQQRAEEARRREEERTVREQYLQEHAEEIRLREEQERERRAELAQQQMEQRRRWEAEKARRRAEATAQRVRLREEKKVAEKAERLRVKEQEKEEKRRGREKEVVYSK